MDELCPSCAARHMIDSSYDENLKNYILSIPEEIKTPPEEYLKRLEICFSCEKYIARVCIECGCYVEMRAAKKVMYCPLSYDRWVR